MSKKFSLLFSLGIVSKFRSMIDFQRWKPFILQYLKKYSEFERIEKLIKRCEKIGSELDRKERFEVVWTIRAKDIIDVTTRSKLGAGLSELKRV